MNYLLMYFVCAEVILVISQGEAVSVETDVGTFIGVSEQVTFFNNNKNVIRFLGIPYAKPPTGNRRFARPEAYGMHASAYNASFLRPRCLQNETINPTTKFFQMSEDCLFLNVYVPGDSISTSNTFTVMIFIHGGSFIYGGSGLYSGDILSAFNDVIVVTLNYRLNTFGFLSNGTASSGNYGLWDQKLAIEWVHDNIRAFGGDSDHVTLFGHSAGSASAMYHALNPGNRGLFQRVITQSGSVLAQWAQQYNPAEMFEEFANEVDCKKEGDTATLECLRAKPANELVTGRFSPVVDGEMIKADPLELLHGLTEPSRTSLNFFSELDFMSGVTNKDGASIINGWSETFRQSNIDVDNGIPSSFFENIMIPRILFEIFGKEPSPALLKSTIHQYSDWSNPNDPIFIRDKVVDLYSDLMFFLPAVNGIKAHQLFQTTGHSSSSYFYVFSHKPFFDPNPLWLKGARHSADIPYVFGLPDSMKVQLGIPPSTPISIPVGDYKLAELIMTMWTNFAKSGNLNSPVQIDQQGLLTWPKFDNDTQQYLEIAFNTTSESVKRYFAASSVSYWNDLVPLLETCEVCEDCSGNKPISGAESKALGLLGHFILFDVIFVLLYMF